MAKGIQIAKDSQDVGKISGDEFYVNSNTPLFKLFRSGSGIQTFIGVTFESYQILIIHNLGYVPFVLAFMDRNPGTARQLCTAGQTEQIGFPINISATVTNITNNSFVIDARTFGSGAPTPGDYGYNYFIYYDRIDGPSE